MAMPEHKTQRFARKTLFFCLMWTLFFVFSILVRLPYFLSKNYWFDGDEAIIGIMAEDLLRTGKVPFFFYGQHYGFATLEVFSAAGFIALFGKTVYSLKLAGLLIHSLAITVCWKWLRAKQVSPLITVLTLLLVLCFPPFSLWAAQMRTVSFLLFALIVYILETSRLKRGHVLLVFGLSLLLVYSQAMTFLFCAAFIADAFLRQKMQVVRIVLYCAALAAAVFAIQWLLSGGRTAHDIALHFGTVQLSQLKEQLGGFGAAFTGFHYFGMAVPEPFWWLVLSRILLVLLAGWLLILGFRVTRSGRRILLLFAGSTVVFLLFLSLFPHFAPRYAINLFTGMLMLLLVLTARNPRFSKRFSMVPLALALFAVAGIFAGTRQRMHFADAPVSEAQSFNELHDAVVRSGKKALFTTDVYLQWQWNYLYGNEVPCSSFYRFERTNRFTDRVNAIYERKPASVGIIGVWGIFLEMDYLPGFNDERKQAGGKYYLVSDVKAPYVARGREVMNN